MLRHSGPCRSGAQARHTSLRDDTISGTLPNQPAGDPLIGGETL
jgi:hypothetical protein